MSITTKTGYRINPQGQSIGNAPSWFTQVEAIFKSYNVPPQYWIPIAVQESGLNPNAIGHGADHSVGLFQLNPVAGQGVGYSHSQLLNPVENAKIAAPYIANAYHAGVAQGLSGEPLLKYTAANSGHVGDLSGSNFLNSYQSLLNGQPLQFPSGALTLTNISSSTSSSTATNIAQTGNQSSLNVSGFTGFASGIAQLQSVFTPPPTAFGLSTLSMVLVRGLFGIVGLGIMVVGLIAVSSGEHPQTTAKRLVKYVK